MKLKNCSRKNSKLSDFHRGRPALFLTIMVTIDKVRVLVVGDSGVGKTSLTHLIANNEALTSPSWTVGCAVEVKLHEYKEGTAAQSTFFIELWDVGGSISHRNARGVFYNPVHGVIFVHDLTNRKSHENLQKWLYEIIDKDGKESHRKTSTIDPDFDPEIFLGSCQIPMLIIGTKLDLVDDVNRTKDLQRLDSIAAQCGANEIFLNCHDHRALAPGTTDAVNLGRFFDKVIERKYFARDSFSEKRKYTTPYTSPITTPFVSPISSMNSNLF